MITNDQLSILLIIHFGLSLFLIGLMYNRIMGKIEKLKQ